MTVNGSKCTPNNLYTNEGLTASFKDLDQIFENSDDTSSDETAVSARRLRNISISCAHSVLIVCTLFSRAVTSTDAAGFE